MSSPILPYDNRKHSLASLNLPSMLPLHLNPLSSPRLFTQIAKLSTMAPRNLQSKYKMNSGHEIPALGYGVRVPLPISLLVAYLCRNRST